MAKRKKKSGNSNVLYQRIGFPFLLFSAMALALSSKFLATPGVRVMQFDFTGSEDFYGWILMVLSLGASSTGLMFALLMKSK